MVEDLLIPGTDPDVAKSYATLAKRAKGEHFGLYEDEVVVLDTETTGFNPEREEIIQVAAARMSGPDIVERFSTLVNPQKVIPDEIVKLTGIDDDAVRGAPTISTVMKKLVAFVGDSDIVAHNAAFDRSFIMRQPAARKLGGDWIDTVELARIALPRLKTHGLEALSEAFGTAASTHDAADDVEALCGVWRILLVALSDMPEGLLAFLVDLRPQTTWPLRKVFAHLAAAQPDARFALNVCRNVRVRASKAEVKADAEGRGMLFPSEGEVAKAFAPDSTVGQMYEGYEQREAQVLMACEVAKAFATDTHRAIEAGTGVGKSIAYLLPAALSAKHNGIGIGIATKTNALMDQLVYHELPSLSEALGGGLSYVALKGYDHYPCLRKLERFAAEEPGTDDEQARSDISMIATLYTYIAQTTWGDLDAVNLYWKNLSRSRICALPGECIRTHCRFFPDRCYLHGLRQRAKSADIVVTNHALLFRDVVLDGSILPPIRHWIVDEAHAVEDEARKQLSPDVEIGDVTSTLEALSRGTSSALAAVRRTATKADGGQVILGEAAKAEEEAERTLTLATSFFSFVKDLEPLAERSSYDRVDLWVNDKVRESGPWSVVEHTGRSFMQHLNTLTGECKQILDLLEASSADFAEVRADLTGISNHLYEIREALSLCIDGDDLEYVFSAQLNRREDLHTETLTASLLDVGKVLADEFYPRMLSVIYTSATIATGSSFDHFAHATGLDLLEEGSWSCLQLESCYDFENNMTVLVPNDMPDPYAASYTERLEELLFDIHQATGGSVLTLFTNRREMERLYESLEPSLAQEGTELLCQRRGLSAKRLRDEFLEHKDTSLFALRSFWEGFDAPGDTLRCVVVPRLPFGRPNDPISMERNLREKNSWGRYTLPEAVLDLKQAAGRLIRTSTDTGFLVLADSRLLTKRYGKAFLQALPSHNQLLLPCADVAASIQRRL